MPSPFVAYQPIPFASNQIYQPNGRLVDLIRLQGEQSAEAQRRSGEIQAQMWGNLAHGITEGAGNIANAIAQRPAIEQQKLKLAEAQQLQQGQQTVDAALKPYTPVGPQPEGEGPAPTQNSYLDAHGLADIPKLSQMLAAKGLGHLAPQLLDSAEKMNDGILKHTSLTDALAKQNIIMLGDWSNGTKHLVDGGTPLASAMDLAAQPYLASQKIDPQSYAKQKAQILQLPPEQQMGALDQFIGAAEQAAGDETVSKDAIKISRYGRKTASNVVPNKLGAADLEKAAMDAYGRQGTPNATPEDAAIIAGWEKTHPKATKGLEAKPDLVIKGTTNIPSYNPGTGEYSFNGKVVPADQIVKAPHVRDPLAQALAQANLDNAKQNLTDKQRRDKNIGTIADGIAQGTIPPDPEGLQRNGLYGDVISELQGRGVNFNTLRQEYLAQKKLINTENSPQGVRLDIAVRSGLAMYDKVDALSKEWQGMGLGPLSRANLKLATEGALGPDAAKLAIALNGQIAQLTSEVATVEQNGMTPTNESRAVAEQGLKSWWGDGTIQAMTAQGRANMRIRDAARRETAPTVPGQMAQPAAPPAAAPAAAVSPSKNPFR